MGRFLGYAHVMAENTTLDYCRKRHRRSKVFVSIDRDGHTDLEDHTPSDEADISEVVLGGMESARLLRQLDPKYRSVIEARLKGSEYEEISEELGISPSNARQIH